MAVTTLEAATAIQKPDNKPRSRCAFPLKVVGIVNGAILALICAGVTMPGTVQDVFDVLGLPEASLLREIDVREPMYMAFALVWFLAVVYMHVDEVNESRLALRSVPETEVLRAFTIEDLIGYFVRAAVLLIPAMGLYFVPAYLHSATTIGHVTFLIAFAMQFLLWKVARRQ